ncbi:HET domain-containing protein [Fusarium falciforme]|uniref:HET domain-containing protein n=1 Tax=Fusarium falciforme TaxID=195108 RepID=UPI002300116F|nr:HET domain-containing protein [Fusarium falciforme]WAO93429.1 HET domain-containing protein [Fusarium falciforme]
MANFVFTPRPFYPSLSSQGQEIRLLHLQPGTGDDAIECDLSVASLESDPAYEALSYQWGRAPTDVSVDGHKVTIPLSLEHALKRLRLADRERILWADAICINQSDVAERNAQVALMADIYRKCTMCLIWLGSTSREFDNPDDRFGGDLPQLLAALATKHHRDQPDAPPIGLMLGFTRIPLMQFNDAGWWRRIWVVQEVVLAPRSTVICGTLEMDFSALTKAAEFVDEHDLGSVWTLGTHVTDDLCHCMDSMKNTFIWAHLLEMRDRVFRLLQVDRRPPEAVISSSPVVSDALADAKPNGVIDVMLAVRDRDCTDPRDKIFGILSLVQDWGSWSPIQADYSNDMENLFGNFAKRMVLGESGPKTLLLSQGIRSELGVMARLPSWVPDWSQKGSGYDAYLWYLETQQPPTPGGQLASILGSTLVLGRGLSRGTITEVTTTGVPLHKSYGQAISIENFKRFTGMLSSWSEFAGMKNEMSLLGILRRHAREDEQPDETEAAGDSGSYARLMQDMERCADDYDFMPDVQELFAFVAHHRRALRRMEPDEEVFYRTLVCDTFPLHLRQPQYHQEALCILRMLVTFYTLIGDPDRFLTRVHSVMLDKMSETLELVNFTDKRLFRAGDQMLGIAPKDAQVGDEVFSFEGVETAFILRSVGTQIVDGKGEQACYKLVGHCYVDRLTKETQWQGAKEVYIQ